MKGIRTDVYDTVSLSFLILKMSYKLQNYFHSSYSLRARPNAGLIKSMRMKWFVDIARIKKIKNSYIIFFGNPYKKRSHGRSDGMEKWC